MTLSKIFLIQPKPLQPKFGSWSFQPQDLKCLTGVLLLCSTIYASTISIKGQTNSKGFLQVEVSSEKRMNKFNFTTCQLVFLRFFEESEDAKKTFQN